MKTLAAFTIYSAGSEPKVDPALFLGEAHKNMAFWSKYVVLLIDKNSDSL
jgi:hypothetical protein